MLDRQQNDLAQQRTGNLPRFTSHRGRVKFVQSLHQGFVLTVQRFHAD
jgi:hypothetical protein